MKIIGLLLFLCGFAWLCYSAAMLPAVVLNATSDGTDSLPRRDTYSARELSDTVSGVGDRIRSRLPWIFTPACVMLVGGLLLIRARPRGDTSI
jgi:hypothetical protein